jgi:hypothetical protein
VGLSRLGCAGGARCFESRVCVVARVAFRQFVEESVLWQASGRQRLHADRSADFFSRRRLEKFLRIGAQNRSADRLAAAAKTRNAVFAGGLSAFSILFISISFTVVLNSSCTSSADVNTADTRRSQALGELDKPLVLLEEGHTVQREVIVDQRSYRADNVRDFLAEATGVRDAEEYKGYRVHVEAEEGELGNEKESGGIRYTQRVVYTPTSFMTVQERIEALKQSCANGEMELHLISPR